MKALVLTEARTLELTERPVREPGSGEVLLRSQFCGICGTDLHATELDMFGPPVTIGHEFAGEIEAVGPGITTWNPGDRVTVNPNENCCRTCEHCRAGRTNLCHSAIFVNSLGVRRDGGMAEFATIPAVHLHRLPEQVDTRRGAWTEPLAVAVRAIRGSGLRLDDDAAVIGGGPIGLLTVQLLRRAGAGRVILVEPSEFRRTIATTTSGADAVYTPGELAAALASSDVKPVHRVYECSGHPSAVQTAIDIAAPGATIRLIGASPTPVSFSAMDALAKEITLSANFIYVDEFDQAISLLARGAVDVDSLTTMTVGLSHHETAFAALRQPDSTVKVLVKTGT
jgi:2-desacetyl-2-hydroxyethyl bacteriochlorophyllide A dehydrogenase